MRIEVEILEQRHLDALSLRIQQRQRTAIPVLSAVPACGSTMRQAGPCAAFVADGETVACAGLIDLPGTGRAILWALFAEGITRVFAALIQKMRALMQFYPRRRYEAYIDPTWPQAQRLAQLGGFVREGLMKSFEADGSDRELWALVRKEHAE